MYTDQRLKKILKLMVLNVISGTHSLPMKMINFLYTLRMKSHNDIAKEEKIVESSQVKKSHLDPI